MAEIGPFFHPPTSGPKNNIAIHPDNRQVIGLVDHTKWNQVALASFCSVEQLTTLVTDKRAPRTMVEQAKAQGIQVVLV